MAENNAFVDTQRIFILISFWRAESYSKILDYNCGVIIKLPITYRLPEWWDPCDPYGIIIFLSLVFCRNEHLVFLYNNAYKLHTHSFNLATTS